MSETPNLEYLAKKIKSQYLELKKQVKESWRDKSDSMTGFQKIFFGIFLIMAVYFYGVYHTKIELLSRFKPATIATPTPTPKPSVVTVVNTSPSPEPTISTKPSVMPSKAPNTPKAYYYTHPSTRTTIIS